MFDGCAAAKAARPNASRPHTPFAQGESARLQSFVGAIAIADLVKTTLGPKGMDKIIQSVRASTAEILTGFCRVVGICALHMLLSA